MEIDKKKVVNPLVKGVVAAGIGTAFTLTFHKFILASGDLEWALMAVGFASFFAGFFADITDDICLDGGEESVNDYVALGGVYVVLGFSFMDGISFDLSAVGFLFAGLLFFAAAYKKSDRSIRDFL